MVGRGTELISLYVPKNKNINDVVRYLKQEQSTAKNIKSDQTRYNVERNLEMCIQRLKGINIGGFALFAGNNHLYEITTECPWYYRCEKTFQTNLIKLDSTPKIAIISMDIQEASFGLLDGDQISILQTATSGIPSKHRKGGQSSQRFKHVREEAKHDWFKRIAEHAREYFLDKNISKLIIHGESFTKREFIKQNLLEYRLQKLVQLSDGCYAGEDGLYECKNMINL